MMSRCSGFVVGFRLHTLWSMDLCCTSYRGCLVTFDLSWICRTVCCTAFCVQQVRDRSKQVEFERLLDCVCRRLCVYLFVRVQCGNCPRRSSALVARTEAFTITISRGYASCKSRAHPSIHSHLPTSSCICLTAPWRCANQYIIIVITIARPS